MKIQLKHFARIEGHMGFVADIEKGDFKSARLKFLEGARLFESIIRGLYYVNVPIVASRICGICSIVHYCDALKSVEKTFKHKISRQTALLRKLMMLGQFIQSHAFHAYFMSLQDVLGLKTAEEVLKKMPDTAKKALRVREFGNEILRRVAAHGRALHPIRAEVGGFLILPSKDDLRSIIKNYDEILAAAKDIARVFKKYRFPKLESPSEFISITHPKEYAIYEGDIAGIYRDEKGKARRWKMTLEQFLKKIKEKQERYNMVKFCRKEGRAYMVGAIARINNNCGKLNPAARRMVKELNWKLPSFNTYENTVAQAVEIIHCVEETKKIINDLIKNEDLLQDRKPVAPRAGASWTVIEAPRGMLFHFYEFNALGSVKNVNIITPTVQLMTHLEDDFDRILEGKKYGRKNFPMDKIKTLTRCYDPCMTCGTH
ncbi:MAG: nickel-dependent hydrogenase large subunit [bacterium]|nr:nickel-dependent hydrogenase large subunit [bacterium]